MTGDDSGQSYHDISDASTALYISVHLWELPLFAKVKYSSEQMIGLK